MPMLLDRDPPEIVVHDEETPCSYIEGARARLPLRLPVALLDGKAFDARLASGDRRHGSLVYRPTCPSCRRCEAIRVDVERFEPSRTHRRILRRGDALLRMEMGGAAVSDDRIALYEKHKRERGLHTEDEEPIDASGYGRFLVDSCARSFELRFLLEDEVVARSIVDRGERSLSAVYCYHDPDHARLSLGTYSILKQVELCRERGLDWLYLGLYIAENASMSYKARYLPHERLIEGEWRRFER